MNADAKMMCHIEQLNAYNRTMFALMQNSHVPRYSRAADARLTRKLQQDEYDKAYKYHGFASTLASNMFSGFFR